MGIVLEDWSSDEMSDDSGTSLNSESDGAVVLPDDAKLHDMLQESGFNWFEFVSIIEDLFGQI